MALKIFSSQTFKGRRPPFEGAYAYLLSLLIGYFVADLTVIGVRPAMLPTQPPPARPMKMHRNRVQDVGVYSGITKRNIFNPDKKIPPALTGDGSDSQGNDGTPVLSQLALSLEGTLVSSNPKKSVATINVKARNETSAFTVDSDIRGLARITGIERRKVIFRNLSNHRLEYIEIPKESALTFGVKEPKTAGEVNTDGQFNFTMKREDLNKYIQNLGQVLNQARMVPNIIPGTGGKVEGFRFVSIQNGSIYEKLGFKPMDVIKSVNGENVNSPTKAMELYNALRTENKINLVIERNGRDENMTYTIPQ